jgi:hypothetical protein
MMRSLRQRLESPRVWAALLFLLALIPRLPGLRLFLTSDEPDGIFWAGSQFIEGLLSGDFSLTYWHFYPGVTMSWLETLGLAGSWIVARLSGGTIETLAQFVRRPIFDLILAARLPYALLTAASVAAFYVLARRLLGQRVALLGALFIAFDPFYLAHSRVAHGDAPVAVFMGLSALAFFVYLRTPAASHSSGGRRYLILSAVMGGLAALTKAPGQFTAIFVILLGVGDWLVESWRARRLGGLTSPWDWRLARRLLVDLALWGVVAAALFVALWPAMWVDPLGTIIRMLDETFGKVEEGHLVFFMGRPTLNPGPWFYLYVIPFRLTPITLLGALASGFMVIGKLVDWKIGGQRDAVPGHFKAAAWFWVFIIALLLLGSVSPKKQDRYLLPLFPMLDLLAAFSVIKFGEWTGRRLHITRYAFGLLLPLTLLFVHALPVVTAYPYYLAYFNPLMGGLPRAAETTLVGWGEGMEQVAVYLNQRPDAEGLYVAATPSQTLLPYFAGTGENFYTNDVALRADYVVLYIAQIQRLAPSPEIVRYFLSMEPEHVVPILGVPYARIYPGPKLITTDVPPDARLANVGLGDQLRLAGYQISNLKSQIPNDKYPEGTLSQMANVEVVLYWHALAPMDTDYTVSVRLVARDGTWLAQHDGWPADGLLPTSQWRQGDYVRDAHVLQVPADVTPGEYEVQVVVYNGETGTALSEPLRVTSLSLEESSP